MKTLNVFFLCLATCLSVDLVIKKRMLGGVLIQPESFPFLVCIQRHLGDIPKKFWLGSLIKPNWILTSAVFLVNATVDNMVIRMTHNYTVQDSADYNKYKDYNKVIPLSLERIISHENFNNSNGKNDIALIQLKEPINGQVVNLGSFLPNYDTTLIAIGWNEKDELFEDIKITETKLGSLQVQIKEIIHCQNIFPLFDIDDKQICGYGVKGTDICGGDTGGPLINEKGEQVGIVNDLVFFAGGHRHSCLPKHGGHPLLFTNIAKYKDWIDEHIQPKSSKQINIGNIKDN